MKNRSRTEYTVINTTVGIGGYILNTILGFVCRVVFTQCLSADYLGVNGLFTNILAMLSFAELGVGSAVVFALYKPLAENDEAKVASLVKFYSKAYRLIGGVVAAAGLVMLPFLNLIITEQPNIHENIYVLYLINLFNTASTYFFSYRTSLVIAAQRNYIVSAVNYAVTIVQSGIQIVLLLITRNYIAYLLVQTVGVFINNAIVYVLAGRIFPYIRKKNILPLLKEEKSSIFQNTRDLLIYKISGLLVNNTDNILITFFSGLVSTGIVSNYTMLVTTLGSLMNLLFNGLTASVGNHNALETKQKKYEMFSFLNMMNFWVFGWGALGILYCSSDIVKLFFGNEYVMPMSIPLVMAVNFFSVGMMNAVWTYKHTMGLFHYGRFMQIGTAILNIVFSIVLGNLLGVFGILAATFVARLFTSLWYDPYAVFVHGFEKSPWLYVRKIANYMVILLIAAALCQLAFTVVRGPLIVQVLLKILLCSLVTNVVFALILFRSPEFQKLRDSAQYIFAKLFRRKQKV